MTSQAPQEPDADAAIDTLASPGTRDIASLYDNNTLIPNIASVSILNTPMAVFVAKHSRLYLPERVWTQNRSHTPLRKYNVNTSDISSQKNMEVIPCGREERVSTAQTGT